MSVDRTAMTDESVDAILTGEAMSLAADADPARAVRLLALHGLLASEGDLDRAAAEAGIQAALKRIEADQGIARQAPDVLATIDPHATPSEQPRRRFVGFRWAPLAAAACVALVGLVWWNITEERRAIATIVTTHKDHGPRRYDLTVDRGVAGTTSESVAGHVDVDGSGQFVIFVPLPAPHEGTRVVFGRSSTEWWILRPDGAIVRGAERTVVRTWIDEIAGDAPFPSMDETFAALATDYDVSVRGGDEGGETYSATRTGDDGTLADQVHITVNRVTRKVRYVRWEWDPPEGSVAQVRAVTARLVERPTFESTWFQPETHLPEGSR